MPLIFLVDDHEDTRELLVEWLRMEGFDVRDFPDAEEALAAIEISTPAAVVTDLMLGGMSGIELLAAIRSKAQLAALPVIACTGRTDQKASAGFTRVLVKPVMPDALSTLLRQLLPTEA